jgi:hypothetical protein
VWRGGIVEKHYAPGERDSGQPLRGNVSGEVPGQDPAADKCGMLKQLEMKNVDNKIGSTIQQNNVATNQHVRTIGRRRRQTAL